MELYTNRTMLYNAVMENNWKAVDEHWEAFKKKYQEEKRRVVRRGYKNLAELCFPVSIHWDNIFHLAVYSGREQPLDQILKSILKESSHDNKKVCDLMVMSVNKYGNTVLHEAAINGNLEAAKLLVDQYRQNDLLETKNEAEETPLFTAAANGNTKIVTYLADQQGQTFLSNDGKLRLKDIHRKNKSGDSVLFVAVQGQHFGTAIELLKLDEELANLVIKKNGMTCLHLLAKIPCAVRSKNQMGIGKKLVFSCLPACDTCDDNDDADNIQIKGFYLKVWNKISAVCSMAKNICEEKRNHEFACKLARTLAEKDQSWDNNFKLSNFTGCSVVEEEQGNHMIQNVLHVAAKEEPANPLLADIVKIILEKYPQDILLVAAKEEPVNPLLADIVKIILEKYPQQLEQLNHKILLHVAAEEEEKELEIPLFDAIRAGNVELVNRILQACPQQIERLNRRNQNILHMAAMYRQKEIFDLVQSKKIAIKRMARQIDKDGYTVLHSVADIKHYKGGTRSGPAYQLQEELEWFSDVEKIIPSNYAILVDHNNKTAEEILKEKHAEQLKNAQTWIKDTSQSCSGVAVLVATVVFAAAFTVPGGNNETNGMPILLNSPAFLFFTTMDIIALSCSLTSVVTFLSVLTSPFELDNFRASLPSRLTFGFALLFIAVTTTMLAFTSTIFLVIQPDQRQQWMMTLICSAAFFPVGVLALTHFPLFVSFMKLLAFPCSLLISCLKSPGNANKSRRKQAHGDA